MYCIQIPFKKQCIANKVTAILSLMQFEQQEIEIVWFGISNLMSNFIQVCRKNKNNSRTKMI